MIKAWTDNLEAGLLDRHGARGSAFTYLHRGSQERAVSVTMPVRVASWDWAFGLAPFFDMNLPEGALRERLRLAFAKATGTFDEFDLLGIVGRSQVGRVRYTGENEQLFEDVPFQSVDEILTTRRDGDLFRYLIEKFATFSGISGVQPKVLVRDESTSVALSANNVRLSPSFKGATHIVKFWDATEFPQLSANEFFCLKVAERSGLPVPPFRLAENAQALVIDRFDLVSDGTYFGFEDFCVLNARKTEEKYSGSYEGSILKRFGDFASPEAFPVDVKKLFTLIVLNCALRNGDAHLKNFGIIYDSVVEQARLAPVYDVVTTTVYIAKDNMALTLNGTTRWPDAKALQKVGETRTQNPPARINEIFEQIANAISETTTDVHEYMKSHSEFEEIGTRMLKEWELGRELSLRPSAPKSTSLSGAKV
jgi:serine/threonine-protein kinase HipA